LTVLLLTACDEDEIQEPEEPDDPSAGIDPSVPAAPGEARAGIVREGAAGEAALFGGLTAEGRAGDVKIYNHLVQFVIQGPYRGNGYMDAGGNVIDVDLVRADGVLGRDTMEDIFLAFDLARLFHADSVEVMADGSDGGAAIVEARGTDIGWDWFQGMLELPEPSVPDLDLEIVTTYELAPDSYSMRIASQLTNAGSEAVEFSSQEGFFASGEDLLPWAPGTGLRGPQGDELECVAFTGKQGEATVSLWLESGVLHGGTITDLAAELGIAVVEHGSQTLGAGQSLELVRYLTVAPDAATAEEERWSTQGIELGTVTGTVTDASSGAGIEGVRVHFVQDGLADAVAGFSMTGADGRYEARLPAGSWVAYAVARADTEHVPLPPGAGRFGPFTAETVNARQLDVLAGSTEAPALPYAAGRVSPPPVSFDLVAGGDAAAEFVLDPPGGLRVDVADCSGDELPAVVELKWAAGGPPESNVPADLRDALGIPDGSRAAWGWTATGTLDIPAIPGEYTAVVAHSWRYGMQTETDVEVVAAETTVVETCLEPVVARQGWLSMDSHLHAAPSFDGALPMEHRLLTCAATGVELPVTTDHDAVVEYRDLAEALDLGDRLRVFPGLEVTTLVRGHFNVFPLEPAPLTQINGGAVAWWIDPKDTSDLFERMIEAGGPGALVQVNHPRSPGMFTFAGYDPETGEPDDPDYWSWEFGTFELINGGVDDVEVIREDWFSMLDRGRIHTPVGVSDSHYRFIPCGLGRTDVYLGTDTPSEVTDEDLRAALLAGHVVVAAGTTLRATLDAGAGVALPGDTVVGASAVLSATVEAPDWIAPGTLRVYRNGEVIHEEALPEASPSGTWFDGSWSVESSEDAWFTVEVMGTEPMGDIWRNHTPYAMTNAFFLDVDGNGWTAPGGP